MGTDLGFSNGFMAEFQTKADSHVSGSEDKW